MILRLQSKSVSFYFFVGVILTLLGGLLSEGFYHFDEHFQILEFAGLKIGTTLPSDLPWEYHEQMRPTFQPLIVVFISAIFEGVGLGSPFFVATITRLITALLVLLVASKSISYLRGLGKTENFVKGFLLCFFCTWFIGFSHYRFSSENWSGIFLILAFLEYQLTKESQNWRNLIVIGVYLGISFLCRYQIAFGIIGFGVWLMFFEKFKLSSKVIVSVTFLSIFSLGILIDSWFYGNWTITTWNYFEQNIILDKVSGFGVDPWYYYFVSFVEKAMPLVSILILLSVVFYLWKLPKDGLSWILMLFLLGHLAVGHKELRFLLPMTYILPFMMVWFYGFCQDRFRDYNNLRVFKIVLSILIVANFMLLLFVTVNKSESCISIYREVYELSNDKIVKLYHGPSNPYVRIIPVKYYQSSNTVVEELDNINEIEASSSDTLVLFACKTRDQIDIPNSYVEVYSTYPNWLGVFNYNQWMERTNYWKVYEVR